MNILFMSLTNYQTIYFHSLYPDLLRQFVLRGDNLYILSPIERQSAEAERVIEEKNVKIVKIRIWNMQKTNLAEKALSMVTVDRKFIYGIKKYLSDIKFDLVLYPTPPITLLNAVEYVKKRDKAITYLLLKDIFPQNAVDIGLMSTTGLKGFVYRYFRHKEKCLYAVSDHIGCMSQANVDYIINNNPEVDPIKVEVCPNSYEPMDMSCSVNERIDIRNKYGIPLDKIVFVYGGNLGKPQDIPFIITCLNECKIIKQAHFVIVGNGTEYTKLEKYIKEEKPNNVTVMQRLPKEDYDILVGACDVGLIFLDHRFTIPNFPSRLLSYMQAKLPVLACTDPYTDIGSVVVDGGFGWWCESNNAINFASCVSQVCNINLEPMKNASFEYLQDHYSVEEAFKTITKHT